jgi:hypothetical protein
VNKEEIQNEPRRGLYIGSYVSTIQQTSRPCCTSSRFFYIHFEAMSLVIRRPAGQNISEPVGVSEQTAVLPHELVPGYFFLGLKEYVCG